MRGYTGTYLEIDLSAGTSCMRAVPPAEGYLGGKGMAALLLNDLLPAGVDALAPANVIVINTGPLTGSGAPGSSRFNLSTKSPATGLIASSNCGGRFGLCLKRCGFDGLILKGRAPQPVWIDLDERGVEICDARHLWGKGALAVQQPHSPLAGKIAIGPAGENLVKFALVMSGDRALARCGVGAVMGSKNLKGITAAPKSRDARASLKENLHDVQAMQGVIRAWDEALHKHILTGEMLHNYGTSVMSRRTNAFGINPTKNFQQAHWDKAESHSGERLREDWLLHGDGCFGCPVRCGRVVRNPDGNGAPLRGPEYEAVSLWGSNLLNDSLGHIITWNGLCDELGLDTISAGVTMGVAMELSEKGLLDTGVSFGSTAGVAELLDAIAHRRGVGDLLAEGARQAARACGVEHIAPTARGLELPAYHPGNAYGHALSYATSNRGGCHLNGGYYALFEGTLTTFVNQRSWRGKASLTVIMQNMMEAVSASGGCLFHALIILPQALLMPFVDQPPGRILRSVTENVLKVCQVFSLVPFRALRFKLPRSLMPILAALEAVTGEKQTIGQFLECGERIWNLERYLNIREGLLPADDGLYGRCLGQGPAEERQHGTPPLKAMLAEYYRTRGWSADGYQTAAKLTRLGLPPRIKTVAMGTPTFVGQRGIYPG